MKTFAFCLFTFALAAFAPPIPVGFFAAPPPAAGGSSLVSSNSLQSYLKFENNLADSFGDDWTDNNGISFGAGKIGQALVTTREDSSDPCAPVPAKYISHGDDTRFDLTANFTISLWVWNADTSVDAWIVSKTSDPGADGFNLIQLGSSTFVVYVGNAGLHQRTAATFGSTPQAEWCHVVMQLSGTDLRIKVNNGAWDTTTAASCSNSAAGINVGASFAGDSALTGYIDGLSFWKRVLSDAEITQIYNTGSKARPQLP
jgi:hypothetical protein